MQSTSLRARALRLLSMVTFVAALVSVGHAGGARAQPTKPAGPRPASTPQATAGAVTPAPAPNDASAKVEVADLRLGVMDENNVPIAATVVVQPDAEPQSKEIPLPYTGETHAVAAPIPLGRYTLKIRAVGYVPYENIINLEQQGLSTTVSLRRPGQPYAANVRKLKARPGEAHERYVGSPYPFHPDGQKIGAIIRRWPVPSEAFLRLMALRPTIVHNALMVLDFETMSPEKRLRVEQDLLAAREVTDVGPLIKGKNAILSRTIHIEVEPGVTLEDLALRLKPFNFSVRRTRLGANHYTALWSGVPGPSFGAYPEKLIKVKGVIYASCSIEGIMEPA